MLPPRVLAHEIMQLPDRATRRARLLAITCPKTRAAVRFYVEDAFARRDRTPLPDYARIEAEEAVRE